MSRPATTTEQLAAGLAGQIPAAWAGAFGAVNRATFIPRRIWIYDDGDEPHPLDRDTDPQRWQQVVYSDTAIMTQFDNGTTVWPDITGDHPTSSASQPSLVLDMLASLDVQDRHRVLEIGSGTGYNAALLAARLGDHAVTTIEIDAMIAEQTRANLATSNYTPTVITGDGAAGYPPGAPYDRIIATASVRPGALPYAWVSQTRPGGIIVTPWGPDYHNGVMARLVVDENGTASGHLSSNLAFMRLRASRTQFARWTTAKSATDRTPPPACGSMRWWASSPAPHGRSPGSGLPQDPGGGSSRRVPPSRPDP